MKPKPSFDPDFHVISRRWYWSARSIGRLVIGVVFFGLTLAAMAERSTRRVPKWRVQPGLSRNPTVFQGPGQGPRAKAVVGQPREPFVMLASAGIDAEMVVQAPVGIDEAMVFNPTSGDQPPVLTAPPLAPRVVPVPGQRPGPIPDRSSPLRKAPRLPAPARPR